MEKGKPTEEIAAEVSPILEEAARLILTTPGAYSPRRGVAGELPQEENLSKLQAQQLQILAKYSKQLVKLLSREYEMLTPLRETPQPQSPRPAFAAEMEVEVRAAKDVEQFM